MNALCINRACMAQQCNRLVSSFEGTSRIKIALFAAALFVGISLCISVKSGIILFAASLILIKSLASSPSSAAVVTRAPPLFDYRYRIADRFIEEAGKGNNLLVTAYLDSGASANARNIIGQVALVKAVREGHINTVKLLVERGAEVNVRAICAQMTKDGGTEASGLEITPLMVAAARQHLPIMTFLIGRGAELNAESHGKTAIGWAVQGASELAVNLLIEKGANVNDHPNTFTSKSLEHAIFYCDREKRMARRFSDRDSIKIQIRSYIKIITSLLSSGAELGINLFDGGYYDPDIHGVLPRDKVEADHGWLCDILRNIYQVRDKNIHESLDPILPKGITKNIIFSYLDRVKDVFHTYEEPIYTGIPEGISIDSMYKGNPVDLVGAAREGDLCTVQVLVAQGADVNMRAPCVLLEEVAKHGIALDSTPLMAAAAREHLPIMTFLIDRGADIQAVTRYYKKTALLWAVQAASSLAVNLLLTRGANVNDDRECFASKSLECVMIYYRHEAQMHARDSIHSRYLEIFKTLLYHGAEPNIDRFQYICSGDHSWFHVMLREVYLIRHEKIHTALDPILPKAVTEKIIFSYLIRVKDVFSSYDPALWGDV